MPLTPSDIALIIGEGMVVLPMQCGDGTAVLVEVSQEALQGAEPAFAGATMEEQATKHRTSIEGLASNKFDAEGADARGMIRITLADVSSRRP
jgi:hypothetical protein